MKKILILALAGLISGTASASISGWRMSPDWYYVSMNLETSVYVNLASISSSGKYKTAFVRYDYIMDQELAPSVKYDLETSFVKYDCSSNPKRSKLLSTTITYNGAVIASQNYDNLEWQIVYPDTLGESTAKFVCSH